MKTGKIDRSIIKETLIILAGSLFLSAVMEAVFLLCNSFDYTVPLGNLMGIVAGVGNFFLMGISLQNAISTADAERAKKIMRISQSLRFLLIVVIVALCAVLPVFNIISAVIPLLFPRIIIFVRAFFIGRETQTLNSGANKEEEEKSAVPDSENESSGNTKETGGKEDIK